MVQNMREMVAKELLRISDEYVEWDSRPEDEKERWRKDADRILALLSTADSEQRVTGFPTPEGVSDGLSLSCSVCGGHTQIDYHSTDESWNRITRDHGYGDRLGVICLECFVRLLLSHGMEPALCIERVDVIGREDTRVFLPAPDTALTRPSTDALLKDAIQLVSHAHLWKTPLDHQWHASAEELLQRHAIARAALAGSPASREQELRDALEEAARSLETIAGSSVKGRCHLTIREIQAYAGNRSHVARAALGPAQAGEDCGG